MEVTHWPAGEVSFESRCMESKNCGDKRWWGPGFKDAEDRAILMQGPLRGMKAHAVPEFVSSQTRLCVVQDNPTVQEDRTERG